MVVQLTAAEAFRAGSMTITPRLNASHASLRSANERLRRMSMVPTRQPSIVPGTEETIVENGSMERLQVTSLSTGAPANGRQLAPALVSNGLARWICGTHCAYSRRDGQAELTVVQPTTTCPSL